jgi:hypothetical protein
MAALDLGIHLGVVHEADDTHPNQRDPREEHRRGHHRDPSSGGRGGGAREHAAGEGRGRDAHPGGARCDSGHDHPAAADRALEVSGRRITPLGLLRRVHELATVCERHDARIRRIDQHDIGDLHRRIAEAPDAHEVLVPFRVAHPCAGSVANEDLFNRGGDASIGGSDGARRGGNGRMGRFLGQRLLEHLHAAAAGEQCSKHQGNNACSQDAGSHGASRSSPTIRLSGRNLLHG